MATVLPILLAVACIGFLAWCHRWCNEILDVYDETPAEARDRRIVDLEHDTDVVPVGSDPDHCPPCRHRAPPPQDARVDGRR